MLSSKVKLKSIIDGSYREVPFAADDFIEVGIIGRGAFGTVFKMQHKQADENMINRLMAVKVDVLFIERSSKEHYQCRKCLWSLRIKRQRVRTIKN